MAETIRTVTYTYGVTLTNAPGATLGPRWGAVGCEGGNSAARSNRMRRSLVRCDTCGEWVTGSWEPDEECWYTETHWRPAAELLAEWRAGVDGWWRTK